MKNFSTLIQEVAQPKAKGEKDFKDLHMKNVEKTGYDHDSDLNDEIKKDKSRKADKQVAEESCDYKKNLKVLKQSYGNFRSGLGKRHKEFIKEKAKSMSMRESKEYDEFFMKALKKFGVTEPDQLSADKKKEFFNYVDKNWKAVNESYEDLKERYFEDTYELLDEVKSMLDEISEDNYPCDIKYVYNQLLSARDSLITSYPKEDDTPYYEGEELANLKMFQLEESFKQGSNKLDDGSSVNISPSDYKTLQDFFKEAGSSKNKLIKRMMNNKEEFNNILDMAKEM